MLFVLQSLLETVNITYEFKEREQQYQLTNMSYSVHRNSTSSNIQLKMGGAGFLHFYDCIPGKCYTIFDWSRKFKFGHVSQNEKSTFIYFNFSSEATGGETKNGYWFKTTGTSFTVQYQVKTCGEFYDIHPYFDKEICGTIDISIPSTGFPLCP